MFWKSSLQALTSSGPLSVRDSQETTLYALAGIMMVILSQQAFVSASLLPICQCLPIGLNPTYSEGTKVSLTLARDEVNYWGSGWDPTWSPAWSAWESGNCHPMVLSNGTIVWVGEGSRTGRRLKDIWDDEVEEISCLNSVPNAR